MLSDKCHVDIPITRIDYSDLSTELSENNSQFKSKSVYEPAAFACKNLKFVGVTCHLDEFPERERTMPHGLHADSPYSPPPSPGSSTSSPPIPTPLGPDSISAESFAAPYYPDHLLPSIKIATFAGQSEIKLKVKQNLAVPGPRVRGKNYSSRNLDPYPTPLYAGTRKLQRGGGDLIAVNFRRGG